MINNSSKIHQGSQVKAILIVFSSVFLFIFLFIIFIFLPAGHEYKETKTENRKIELELKTLEQRSSEQIKILNELELVNKSVLDAFKYPVDDQQFVKNVKFIDSMKLVKDDNQTYKEFVKRTYEIKTLNSPNSLVNFFTFLKNGEKHQRIYDIDFPIVFDKNLRDLQISFFMNTYRLKYVPKPEVKTIENIDNLRTE